MSDGTTNHFPQAQTVSELNLHLVYLQRDVSKLLEAIPLMATRADIDALARRLDGYATQDEVRSIRVDMEELRQQVETSSVRGSVKSWAEWAQRLSAIAAFVAVCALSVAHLVVKLQLL